MMKIKIFPGKRVKPLVPCSTKCRLMIEADRNSSVHVNTSEGLMGKNCP